MTDRKAKLTDAAIRAYQPQSKKYYIGDASCPGLVIRITTKGVKSFAFAYHHKGTGKTVWLTFGRYPDLPLARARELANDARKTASIGGTPQSPKTEGIEAEKKSATTYADVVALYHHERLTTLRSGHATRTKLARIGRVYGWDDRPVASITDDDAAVMLHDIAIRRGKRTMANGVKHACHTMFKWARQPGRKFVTVNPFADLAAPGGPRVQRDRFLSAAEIRQVWGALDHPERFNVSADAATALRLILVTAARPGMVAGIVGSELRDLRGPSVDGPHWELPASRMKNGKAFITPLSGLALDLLRPHLKADPAATLFDLRANDLHEAAARIVAGLGMDRWTPHDLRRTAATILSRDGRYADEHIGEVLAHTRKGVTAIYARGDKFDLKRDLSGFIERFIRETLAQQEEAIAA